MTNGRTCFAVTSALAVIVASGVGASSVQQRADRQSIYVIAAQDSGLLTMCPGSREATLHGGRSWKSDGRARSSRFTDDLQLLRFPPRESQVDDRQASRELRDDPRFRTELSRTQAILPAPRASTVNADAVLTSSGEELGRDIISTDLPLKQAVERELVRLGRVEVADELDTADLVLFVEGSYIALAASVTPFTLGAESDQPPAALATVARWGDWQRNVLQSVLAIAVPVEVYRQTRGEIPALLAARVWEGSEVLQPPYQVSEQFRTTGVTRWETRRTWQSASPEAVVWQFAGMKPRPASHPPLCAASNHAAWVAAADSNTADVSAPEKGAELATPSKARTSESPPAFKGGVTYVSVPVSVTDAEGRPMVGLDPTHFRIYEDETAQVIDRVDPPGAPVNVVLLVDSSSSMRRWIDESRAGTVAAINAFSRLGVPVIVSFDRRVVLHSKLPDHLGRSGSGISQPTVGRSATRLYDALELVLTGPLKETSRRAALVILTDGVDTASRLTDADTILRRLGEFHMPAYVVQYDTSQDNLVPAQGSGFDLIVNDARPDLTRVMTPDGAGDPDSVYARAADFLRQMTDVTGGRLVVAQRPDDLEKTFASIAAELSEQYTVAYYPTNQKQDGTYRRIRVEVDRPGVNVRARAGYYQAPGGGVPRRY